MSDDTADLTVAALDVLDRLHQLLTIDELYGGYRDDLDRAIRDAATVLDSYDHQTGTDQPAEASSNPESGTPDDSEAVKYCPRCHTTKPVDEFGRNRSAHDGRQGWCKPCMREYDRERRAPANTARGDSTSDVASQARPARRLTEPTGQPPEPDPDAPAPVHAGAPSRQPATITPLT